MQCRTCNSENLSTFSAEVALHSPGLKGLDIPIVWVFPQLVVCLACGVAEFAIPEDHVRELREGKAPSGTASERWAEPSPLPPKISD
jgi:hypothetical protein